MKKRQFKKEVFDKTVNLDDETLINETKELYQLHQLRQPSRTARKIVNLVISIIIIVLLLRLAPLLIPVYLLLTMIFHEQTEQEFREETTYKYHIAELKRRNYSVIDGAKEIKIFKNKY